MTTIQDAAINRVPAGLLGLLDIKSMGATPNRIEQRIRPIVDLQRFWSAQGRQFKFNTPGTVSVNNVGIFISNELVVPPGKAWLVESHMAFASTLGAGAQLAFAATIFGPNNQYIMAAPLTNTYAVGNQPMSSLNFDGNIFVALPGYKFGCHVAVYAAGPTNVEFTTNLIEVDY